MKRGRKCKREYDDFLDKFAEKLVTASKLWDLPPSPCYTLTEVDNYFEGKTVFLNTDRKSGLWRLPKASR